MIAAPLRTASAVVAGTAERVPVMSWRVDGDVAAHRDRVGANPAVLAARDGRLVLDGSGRSLGVAVLRGAFDTGDGRAVVRLQTAECGIVHVTADRIRGELQVDRDGPVDAGLGTVEAASAGTGDADGDATLSGTFGQLRLAADAHATAIDRWSGRLDAAAELRTARDPVHRLVGAVLAAPDIEAQITVATTRGSRRAHLLSARGEHGVQTVADAAAAGGDRAAGADPDAVEVVVFDSADLPLRVLDLAGLLAHPTAPLDPSAGSERGVGADPATIDGSVAVQIVHAVRRPGTDRSVLRGGAVAWSTVGRRGWVLRHPDDPSQEPVPVSVGTIADEILTYVADRDEVS